PYRHLGCPPGGAFTCGQRAYRSVLLEIGSFSQQWRGFQCRRRTTFSDQLDFAISSSYAPSTELATWVFNVNSNLADHGLDSGTDRLLTEAPDKSGRRPQ